MVHFTQTGKMMTPSDYDKICTCNTKPKATAKKSIQRDAQKHYK